MSQEIRRSTCSRDCPDACGILATVQDGEVTALKGDPQHPVTKGFLCYRTSRFLEQQNSPNRLTRPLLRRGGRLVEVALEKALDLAARRLLEIRQESGPEAIFHYRSGGSLGLLKLAADRFFELFGPCARKTGDICSGAGEAAQVLDFGISDSNDLFDLRHSQYIFLWGKNPAISSVHLVPLLREARDRGARITLIDPVCQQSRSLAHRVLQPRPGSDAAVALGVVRVLVEKGWLDPKVEERCDHLEAFVGLVLSRSLEAWALEAELEATDLEELAAEFHEGPAAILVGWGMQRRQKGGSIVRALDALSAVSGNLFRSGGGCSFYYGRRQAFATRDLVRGEAAAPRLIREPLLAQDLQAAVDPPVRAIWVTAGNPVCMLPDAAAVARAFEAVEFKVVVDPFLTDTGRRADLVLPVPTLLEDDDLLGAYGHHYLAESRPVIPPPPDVLHELVLYKELARRVGLEKEMAGSVEDYKRRLLSRVAERGLSLESLREGPKRNPMAREQLFADGRVQTPSGRVNLLREAPAEPEEECGDYPFWLFSNSTEKSQCSQWAGKGLGERTWVAVHPEAAPGLSGGQEVLVQSHKGELRAELRLDEKQRRDVAIMPKGGHFDAGHCANSLVEARASDIGLGAAYLDCRVRLVGIGAEA